jgi:hypothetical protein
LAADLGHVEEQPLLFGVVNSLGEVLFQWRQRRLLWLKHEVEDLVANLYRFRISNDHRPPYKVCIPPGSRKRLQSCGLIVSFESVLVGLVCMRADMLMVLQVPAESDERRTRRATGGGSKASVLSVGDGRIYQRLE